MWLQRYIKELKKAFNYILKIGLPFVLGGAILWWMYRGFDWTAVRLSLQSGMNWWWMLLTFPFGILAQVFRALRWQQVLRPLGEQPRLHTCINAIFLSYASSLVIPRVGEVLRCGVLKRWDGISFSKGVGTVVTERVVDMAMIAALSVVVILLEMPVFVAFAQRTGMTLGGLFAQFTPTGWAVTMLCAALVLCMGVWLLVRLRIFSRTRKFLQGLTDGLLSVRQVHNPWLFLLHSVGIWVSYYLHFYLAFYCFGFTSMLGWDVALVAFVVGTFAVLVPTPNGAGPWHFAVKTVLVLFGVAGTDGALFALIVHTIQTLLVIALGIYAVLALSMTRRMTND